MQLSLFQVDAFAESIFRGNPAAVVPLPAWLPDELMQNIAAENNLSETAFFIPADENGAWGLRWFTPQTEVDLCGHATLATAYVIFSSLKPDADSLYFQTRSGRLAVRQAGELLALDFPALPPENVSNDTLIEAVKGATGRRPQEVWRARDLMAVFAEAADVASAEPNNEAIKELDAFALLITAPGSEDGVDFVSRFFAPARGIHEDPVTGSAHCTLVPYWSRRLGKTHLLAHQISQRGGVLHCEARGDRVEIAGAVTPYLEGTIQV